MRRIQLVFAALAVAVASFAAMSGPAMADDLNCRDAWGNWIRCDGTYYAPVNTWDDSWNNDWSWWNPWWWNSGWEDVQSCPFWGDTSGIVNQWDCFG
jgi:hypothetical protein